MNKLAESLLGSRKRYHTSEWRSGEVNDLANALLYEISEMRFKIVPDDCGPWIPLRVAC